MTAPEGQPYLGVSKVFNWPKGAVEYPLDLALPRGVVIRGKVTEEGSGKPVAGARISFGTRRTAESAGASNGRAASGSDGSFPIAVSAQPGLSRRPPPATITCFGRSTTAWFARGSRVAAASTPTPSSPATRSRPARAWTSTSCFARP